MLKEQKIVKNVCIFFENEEKIEKMYAQRPKNMLKMQKMYA